MVSHKPLFFLNLMTVFFFAGLSKIFEIFIFHIPITAIVHVSEWCADTVCGVCLFPSASSCYLLIFIAMVLFCLLSVKYQLVGISYIKSEQNTHHRHILCFLSWLAKNLLMFCFLIVYSNRSINILYEFSEYYSRNQLAINIRPSNS